MTAARKLMDNDEFLRWCETQEDSYELVDGVPVLKYWNGPEMRAGGNARHADVIGNIYAALRTKLRGGPVPALHRGPPRRSDRNPQGATSGRLRGLHGSGADRLELHHSDGPLRGAVSVLGW